MKSFRRGLCAFFVVFVFPGLAFAFDPVLPGRALEFPRDAGAHPGHRIEWWYVTGQLEAPNGVRGREAPANPIGFQVTFFRVRNPGAEKNPSRFAPKQLLFAHAAIADPAERRLLHDQRSARMLDGLVEAKLEDTGVRLDDWFLERAANGYRTRVAAADFTFDLSLAPTQPVLLQGDRGFSRKGPRVEHASHYYSEPHLRVGGQVTVRGRKVEVSGSAWLDHEWSSEYLMKEGTGWDWVGANLDDGSAVMAFRIRGKAGETLWASGTVRPRGGHPTTYGGADVEFRPRRKWTSPRTGTAYPVSMDVRVGNRTWTLEPLFDDQELDARASTGTLYWEGAVRMRGEGAAAGRGYLELTGYAERVPF